MSNDLPMVLAVAAAAALASLAGGLLALWRKPTTLFVSMSLGFAGGVLLATISFGMLPRTLQLTSLPVAVSGFVVGFLAIYAFDLFIYRGRLAGEKAEQHSRVERFHRRHRPRGGEVTVLAGGTSAEELIEGLSIGVGAAIQPGLGLLVGLAIMIDNLSEGLSIGEIVQAENAGDRRARTRRILAWTGLVGAAVFVSALIGWFLLRDLPQPVLGWLFGAGAGGMFYLTVTDLVPLAEERQYQQLAAVAMAAGFMIVFALSASLL